MKNLTEVQKNYFVCAILNAIVALGMLFMKKWVLFGVCVGCAVLFAIMGVGSIIRTGRIKRENLGKGKSNE